MWKQHHSEIEAVEEGDIQIQKLLCELADLVSSLKVLKEAIEHHAVEVGESQLFEQICDLTDDATLERLGQNWKQASHGAVQSEEKTTRRIRL